VSGQWREESEERARPFAQNAKESGTPESRTIEYATRPTIGFPNVPAKP